MIRIEGRLDVKVISGDALRQYMAYRGYTLRSLAAKVSNGKVRVAHSTIGHLLTGERKSVRPEVAQAIAKALDCPVDALFVAEVSKVSREVRRTAA